MNNRMIYWVYDAKTDELLCIGTAEECERAEPEEFPLHRLARPARDHEKIRDFPVTGARRGLCRRDQALDGDGRIAYHLLPGARHRR